MNHAVQPEGARTAVPSSFVVGGEPQSTAVRDVSRQFPPWDKMGRAGFEPATLGLKVAADALAGAREGSQERMVERNQDRTPSGGLTDAC